MIEYNTTSILKIKRILLRKILPQSGFKFLFPSVCFGIKRLFYPIRLSRHMIIFIAINDIKEKNILIS